MDSLEGPFPIPKGLAYLAEPFRDPAGLVCWTANIKWGFLAFLIFLQVILIMWFGLIMRVLMKVIKGAGAEDVRSDGEGEDEEVKEVTEFENNEPLEEEVGVESLNFKEWEARSGGKTTSSSSGLSLPGHSEYKELLNRVGCEKQID
jgi:very-long-chain ceramide synthase